MRRLHSIFGCLLGLTVGIAYGQTTYTWTGLAGDQFFNTPGNWQGGFVPTGNSGDNIVFGVYPQQFLKITTSLNVGDISFNGIQDGFYLTVFSGTPDLTINGNVQTTVGSRYWGLFELPVILSAGNHTYTTAGNADIYHFSTVSGAGGIIKNGPNSLILARSNTYSGGTVLNSGWLYVGVDNALGTGTVTFNGGILATSYTDVESPDVTLPNSFVLGANPIFGGFISDSQSLRLGNNALATTLAPVTGVTTVNFNLQGKDPMFIDGRIIDGAATTTYTFAGLSPFYLAGDNSYTGGTLVHAGATVVFQTAASLPAAGLVTVGPGGYVGLADNSVAMASYLGRINPVASEGTIGFDGGVTFPGAIDLTGFANASVAIGTMSSATLTGPITPNPAAGGYRFSGSGWLYLRDAATANPLTGGAYVEALSLPGRDSLMVVLKPTGTNDYSGNTFATGAGIVFDSVGALSASTSLNLVNAGYFGVTDTSGLTLADLVAKLDTGNLFGAIGVDSSFAINNPGMGSGFTYSTPVDLSSLPQPVYFGSASSADITGTITTTNGGLDDYYLAGFNGTHVTISSQLTGAKQLHVGVPGDTQGRDRGTGVHLTNLTNDYAGGTVINSGWLTAYDPLVLGTGGLIVDSAGSGGFAGFETTIPNLAKNINLVSGVLDIYAGAPLTLSGVISGSGGLLTQFGSPLTISGNNTYSGGSEFFATPVTATTNTALGSGSLSLTEGAHVSFNSSAPQIGSLLIGDTDLFNGIFARLDLASPGGTTLTINQGSDGFFDGSIIQSGGGTGAVVKTGSGTLTVNGNLNAGDTVYAGGTTILQGRMIAGTSNAFGPGSITINGGSLGLAPGVVLTNAINLLNGALGGSGTIASGVTVGLGGILAPGNSPGTLTFTSGLTLASGGQLDFEVQSAGAAAGIGYDLVSISTGPLSITATSGSTFTIKLTSLTGGGTAGPVGDFSAGTAYSWMLFTGNTASGITAFAANKFTIDTSSFSNSLGGGSFSLVQGTSGGNPALFLNFSPVPEPSTYALLAVGLGSLGIGALRRRRK